MIAEATVGLVAAGVTFALVPATRRFAHRIGAVKLPNERSVHTTALPEVGGAAMLIGVLAALAVAGLFGRFRPVFDSPAQILGVAGAALVAYGSGFVDDLRGISAPAKVASLVLTGSILSLAGVSILYFRVPFSELIVLSPDLSALLSVFWVVGMCNAVNLIDGLDGLAAGIVAIAAGAFYLYSNQLLDNRVIEQSNIGPLLAVVLVGVCVGFLPYNFHPASIMMGDGGALLLGVLLAASTISVGGQSDDPFSGQAWFFFAPLVIPLLILGVPILDTLFAIVRRASRRTGVTEADKDHLHHRLMRMGHGHRQAVVILWAWTAVLSGFVLVPVYTRRGNGIVPLGLVAFALLLFTLFAPWFARIGSGRPEGEGGADAKTGSNQVGKPCESE